MTEPHYIPDNEVVYRVLRNKICRDEDTGEITPDAFYLRPDEEGLSVFVASQCTPEDCGQHLSKHYGVVSLPVAYIRSLGLEVQHAPPPPGHAEILKLPHTSRDPARAEYLARRLADCAELQCERKRK